jgi:hypothetical protein
MGIRLETAVAALQEFDRANGRSSIPDGKVTGCASRLTRKIGAFAEGLTESRRIPHAETLELQEILDEIRRQLGVVHPAEKLRTA